MSNKVSYVFIAQDKFSRIAKEASAKVGVLTKKMRGLGNQVRQTNSITSKASLGISSGFAKMAAAAAGFFGAKAFLETGMRFQDALLDLSAITGSTGDELKYLSDETLRLAKTSRTAQDEVATAFKLVASAKSELLADPAALSRVTEQVLLLKNATGMELAMATDVAVTALNQFGEGAEAAGRFVNVLAAGSKVGASEVAQTGEALRKSGVAAKMAKLSFEETNAMIQVLGQNGLKASEAGTGLQGTLLRLESQAIAGLKPSVVGINKALENLAGANLDTATMVKLFGQENLKTAGILIANAPLVKRWTAEITGTNIAQDQANARMSTFRSKIEGLGIAINDKLIKAFMRLEPQISAIVGEFTAWIDTISDADIKSFTSALSTLASVMKGLLTVGGMVYDIFAAITDLFRQSMIGKTIQLLAQGAAAVVSGDFSHLGKSTAALTAGDSSQSSLAGTPVNNSSTTDVNVNLAAPAGTVESVKTSTSGGGNANVGVNMATAGI